MTDTFIFNSDSLLRIASLVPSLTELLFSLDLGSCVVARTGFCVHPRDKIRSIPKVGGTKNIDCDALLATSPTHLVVNIDENPKEIISQLRAHIPEVIVTHPLIPDDNLVLFREFGRLFDRVEAAKSLTVQFDTAHSDLAFAATHFKPLKALYLIWKDPWFTIAPSTYVSSMLASANLLTLLTTSGERYPVIASDDPVWSEADVILLSSEPYAFREKHVDELKRTLTPAKPVLLVDGELLSWYGSRAVEGLRYLPHLRARIDSMMV